MSNMQLGEDTITMSMTLNPVNEAAFQKAVQSLETLNRAAVFHPTGTGKSCIAWKVVEAHPQTTFFWLVAGAQRLALRQAELTRYNGGTLPGNVRFCDCEKLAAATPEQWVRLSRLPRSLARSLLMRLIRASLVNIPSLPKGISRSRK